MPLDYSDCWFVRIGSFLIFKTNAMLQLFTTHTYQDRVDEIYKLLESDRDCSLRLFEWRMRRIHCLNLKIKQRSADMGRKEDIY